MALIKPGLYISQAESLNLECGKFKQVMNSTLLGSSEASFLITWACWLFLYMVAKWWMIAWSYLYQQCYIKWHSSDNCFLKHHMIYLDKESPRNLRGCTGCFIVRSSAHMLLSPLGVDTRKMHKELRTEIIGWNKWFFFNKLTSKRYMKASNCCGCLFLQLNTYKTKISPIKHILRNTQDIPGIYAEC